MKPRSVWRPEDLDSFRGPLLIDTHVWVWYLDGEEQRMSAAAAELVRGALRGEGVLVSDISVWELGTKAAKGRIVLSPSVQGWIERASRRPGFSFLPLDRETLLASTQLGRAIHGDPADRMLIASASLAAVPLATADPLILAYAEEEGGFSACDVRP